MLSEAENVDSLLGYEVGCYVLNILDCADRRSYCCLSIIGRAKRAPHWGVQSRFRVIYICMSVGMYVCRGPKSVGGNTWAKRAHAQSQYCAVKSNQ